MVENFRIPSNVSIAGYRWDCENPEKVVCLIHGIGEHIGRYKRLAAALNENNIVLLGMDHRGHGLSEGKRGHTAPRNEVLADIDSFLAYAEAEFQGLPIVLYGHSMGGNIVLDYRYRGRLAGLPSAYIVSAPWIRLYKPFPKPVVKLAGIMAKIKPDFKVSSSIDESMLGNPEHVEGKYNSDPLVHHYISVECASDCMTIGELLYSGCLNHEGEGAERPLLLMHGDADKICSVEATRHFAAHAKNCNYIEWPGYSHEIHNGGKVATGDDVIAEVVKFVKSI